MNLQIQIKKEHNKPSTLSCNRQDGTVTYGKLQIGFEIHDIAHYVIETQLELKNAFYGLLSKGFDIHDFQLPNEKRPEALKPENLPIEALATEHLVNLLTIDFLQSESKMNIVKTLNDVLSENELAFPREVKAEEISSIQEELAKLMQQWNQLQHGECLEMFFEIV